MLYFLVKFHKKRHVVGLFLLFSSLAPFLFKNPSRGFSLFAFVLFCFGIIFLSDYGAQKLTGSSYLTKILNNGTRRSHFILISIIAGIILEAMAAYFGHLWRYPHFSSTVYVLVAVFLKGFAWYFLCILMSYEVFKDIFDHYIKPPKNYQKNYFFEKIFFQILLIVGIISLSTVFYQIILSTNYLTKFYFNIDQYQIPYISFNLVLLACLGFFSVFEYIEHSKHRSSLLSDLMHGYFNPLLSIIIASITLGFYMEVQNEPIGLWVYINWPLEKTIFGLPIMIFVLWPVHYILFLSFYRAFDRSSIGIWTKK